MRPATCADWLLEPGMQVDSRGAPLRVPFIQVSKRAWGTYRGIDLFDDIEAAGNGVVRVGATDAWASLPPGNQQSYANTLVDRWAAARGYSGPATVQIVGPDGKVLLESKKP